MLTLKTVFITLIHTANMFLVYILTAKLTINEWLTQKHFFISFKI